MAWRDQLKRGAVGPMILRGGIVAVNFGVMIGLAALLGLEKFGELAPLWGASLVLSAIVSFGGPLLLLRDLTDGHGMAPSGVVAVLLVWPGGAAIFAVAVVALLYPQNDWTQVIPLAFVVNLSAGCASVLRAKGSVTASMVLRDAGPTVALGLAVLLLPGGSSGGFLALAAFVLALFCLVGLFWLLCQPVHWSESASRTRFDGNLYATTVLGMGMAQMDIVLGALVLPPDLLGLYVLMRRVINLVALPVTVATWITAPHMSAAHGKGDKADMAEACANATQIAFWPGAFLALAAVISLPVWGGLAPIEFGLAAIGAAFILISVTSMQVLLAASFTFATLCGMARQAAIARLQAIVGFCFLTVLFAWTLGLMGLALAYAIAMIGSALWLWWQIWVKLGVDTSALVLIGERGRRWSPS